MRSLEDENLRHTEEANFSELEAELVELLELLRTGQLAPQELRELLHPSEEVPHGKPKSSRKRNDDGRAPKRARKGR
jgi:hypothetical protein